MIIKKSDVSNDNKLIPENCGLIYYDGEVKIESPIYGYYKTYFTQKRCLDLDDRYESNGSLLNEDLKDVLWIDRNINFNKDVVLLELDKLFGGYDFDENDQNIIKDYLIDENNTIEDFIEFIYTNNYISNGWVISLGLNKK